jgi:hypothetical protein
MFISGITNACGVILIAAAPVWSETCPAPGDCCDAHDTPGCSDAVCCQTVCDVDPFCCSVAWDGLCVFEGSTLCAPCPPRPPRPVCGGIATGLCCVPHKSPGCSDAACCDLVCAIDPPCCEEAWDMTCVTMANTMCPGGCGCLPCPGEGGDCDRADGTPGCADLKCCTTICEFDSFCCSVAWDGICVEEASFLCIEEDFVQCGACKGPDLNGDFNVDGADIGLMLAAWDPDGFCGATGICGDLDGDSAIDEADLGLLLAAWSEGAVNFVENEICGDDTNGGCNSVPTVVENVACGWKLCGSVWSSPSLRDTDWYEIDLSDRDGATLLTVYTNAEFAASVFIVDTHCPPKVFASVTGAPIGVPRVSACLPPGAYRIVVVPSGFFDMPCRQDYQLTIECDEECR